MLTRTIGAERKGPRVGKALVALADPVLADGSDWSGVEVTGELKAGQKRRKVTFSPNR